MDNGQLESYQTYSSYNLEKKVTQLEKLAKQYFKLIQEGREREMAMLITIAELQKENKQKDLLIEKLSRNQRIDVQCIDFNTKEESK
jgi:uncharacterized membrane protein YgaE (UPF0421/DUF939 family)